MKSNKPLINLLWTGGLDSTYRLCELSRQEVVVQCYYIIDPTRGSIKQEINAMDEILRLLRGHKETKAILNDVIKIEFEEIRPDQEIQKSYSFFENWNKLGSQYDYIARFAKQNNLKLEVGLEGSARGKASNVLNEFGSLELQRYGEFEGDWSTYYRISPLKASKECQDVFGSIHMPALLFRLEKVDEVRIMKDWGKVYEKIAKKTWFCHRPVLGYPCGQCNPCKDALNEGMSWRVPKIGRILGFGRRIYYSLKFRLKGIMQINGK